AEALACVRPEFIRVAGAAGGNGNVFRGKVETLLFVGDAYAGEIRIGGTLITTSIPAADDIAEGGEVSVAFDPDHCFLLPA
ncbi:MAG: TOBE domain-containing protein, partial [Deltaproteobacteria bacterium]|nr:TOBE domain-containing protein [Deltaproteobacteria bacterium]